MTKFDKTPVEGMAGWPRRPTGTPAEVGALAVFLACAAADHIAGEIITIVEIGTAQGFSDRHSVSSLH